MKILFFIDSLKAGGKERRLVELINSMSTLPALQIEIVVMNEENHFNQILKKTIKIHYLIRKNKYDYSIFKKFYKICKIYRPEIVHTWDGMTTFYAIPTTKILGIKLINGMITNASQHKKFGKEAMLAKVTFPFSDFILSNSVAGLSAYNAPKNKSDYVHNGFNFSRISNLNCPELLKRKLNIKTPFIIGMVATFSEKKDYKTYFKSAQNILKTRKDVTFLSIGFETDSKKSKSLILDNKEYFRFLGKITDVESYINIMDICILSTYTEGISNAILEYMALGKPVIATSGGGTQEIIKDGHTGLLIAPTDPKALSEKITYLLNNPKIIKIFGETGRLRIKNHFSIESMTNSYLKICQNLIQKSES